MPSLQRCLLDRSLKWHEYDTQRSFIMYSGNELVIEQWFGKANKSILERGGSMLELTTGQPLAKKDIYISLTLRSESRTLENIRWH